MKKADIPWWRPDVMAKKLPFLRARTRLLAATRVFFDGQGFDAVETPALQVTPCLDVHIHGFETALWGPDFKPARTLYLHTSPEFAMKKLLVAGLPRIYQICPVYRNGENTRLHSSEFTMLEWYRAGARYHDIAQDCVALLRACAQALNIDAFKFEDKTCNPFADAEFLSVRDAFARYADIDLDAVLNDRAALAAHAKRLNIHVAEIDAWDDIFLRILGVCIEPHLGMGKPTFLMDYPTALAMLARRKADDPRYAERFELYVCGIELANAYGELTDADEQRARFEADMVLKKRIYGFDYPVDTDFLAALEHGMPESAGIALGVDRLVMLATGTTDIAQVLWAGKP